MVIDNIRRYYSEMFLAEKKAADYILAYPQKVIGMSISQLAKASGSSDATIIRMCKHIGFTGFHQMKISLATEFGKKQLVNIDEDANNPQDVVEFFNRMAASISDSAKNISMDTLMKAVDLIAGANTAYIVAWGNTGAIASDLSFRLSRLGVRTFHTVDVEYSIRSVNLGSPADILIAITHSGTSIPVLQLMDSAHELGMKVILITDAAESKAVELADYVLHTSVSNPMFHDFGGASHVFEYMVVDALLYFLKDKELPMAGGDRAEVTLSEYKL